MMHTPIPSGAHTYAQTCSVRIVEASAFMSLTKHIVRYRAAGLSVDPHDPANIIVRNKVIFKVPLPLWPKPSPDRLVR